ncbi:hypothetical protein GCM10009761_22310 [Agromyces terreus]
MSTVGPHLLRHRQHRGLCAPSSILRAGRAPRLALWDGLQSQWLVSGDFDLAEEFVANFRG